MEIRTVAVLGAGAVGSYFLAGLEEKLGENLWTIAEGSRRARLEAKGILVNGRRLPLHLRTPMEAHGVDLLLVAVKYGALEKSLEDIAAAVGENTLVLSLMNGVDSEERIAGRVGEEHLLYSMMKIASERRDGSIIYDPAVTMGVYFGEKSGERTSRVKAVCRLLEGTGVRYTVSEDIQRDIWMKYALNISRNLPQAILGCGFGAYRDSGHVAYLSERMRREVEQVARAKGIDITDRADPKGQNSAILSTARFSTLQDLDAGRPTEIEMFSGALLRMGKELGIETPYNDFAYHAIKALEEKNAGRFDYA